MQLRVHTDSLTSTTMTSATIAVMCMSVTMMGGCGEDVSESVDTRERKVRTEQPVELQTTDDLPLPAFTELSVQELLHRWIAARNNQQFDAYAALYATRFDGVDKRQSVPVRYVREQWLNRAEKRFDSPMKVALQEEVIHLMPGGANISLREKVIKNGETAEVRRHLLVVAEDGELRIASERIANAKIPANTGEKREKHKILNEFFFVLDNRYIVFSTTDMEKDGALYVDKTTALKRAHRNEVPRRFRRLLKRKFVVSYENGSTAVMKVTDTRAIAKYAVHAAIEAYWKEKGLSEVEMGELLWEMASRAGSVYLVGILKETRKGALWAYPVRPRTPEIYSRRKLDKAYIRNIKRRFRRYTESKILQSRFDAQAETYGLSGKWMDYESTVYGNLFRSQRGNKRFAAVSIYSGKGCGDFYGFMQGFFHMQKGIPYSFGSPSEFYQGAFIDDRRIIQAIDIDHDGIPEFVAKNKLMYKIDDDWFVYELKIPLTDCPC